MKATKQIFDGTLSISRTHGGDGHISIRLTDELSGCEFATIEIFPHDFGCAITGLSFVPMKFVFRPELVGKKREAKTEIIEIPTGETPYSYKGREQVLLAPFEVDGWKGRADELTNHHNCFGQKVRVNFVRYVEVPA